jgi:hypothetical protein
MDGLIVILHIVVHRKHDDVVRRLKVQALGVCPAKD